jgi:site-specific DNA-adenine methylase
VLVLNRDAVDVIHTEDAEHTLFYLDPPYPHSTRGKADLYRFEMTDDDHHPQQKEGHATPPDNQHEPAQQA